MQGYILKRSCELATKTVNANVQGKGIPNGWSGYSKTTGTKMCGRREQTTI